VWPQIARTLSFALAILLLAAALGLATDPWLGIGLAVAGIGFQLARHFRNFALLERWSESPSIETRPESWGPWDAIFSRLYRHEKALQVQIAQRDDEIGLLTAAGQALPDGVILLDDQNRILFCNTTAELLFGLDMRSDRHQPVVNLVRQPDFIAYLEATEFSRPLIMRAERGEERVLAVHVIAYAGNRRLLHVRDITLADRLDRMRRDFVANVSHELRTPLTVLSGFLETLQELELDTAERNRYLAMMAEQSGRMQSIVQDLLTLSTLESAPPPECEPLGMSGLVDKLRRDAEALSGGRHRIVLESVGSGDLVGAGSEITSALGNLVSNAVRYTPAGGTIRLQWRINAEGAEFAVSDTGIGIDAKHLPRLTERFYRVDRGRSRDSGGTGLGLAIVKHALNRHQARLEVSSTPGVGSRFAAVFPASRVTGA
jgi:two-component system, OmpR family, phosphate regulon sensor histidine kinase PhoR